MNDFTHLNPFPGIRNFEPEEDFLFFGRDEQIRNMLGILAEKHFLALIGYSGSGKSSLIKAGIIPAIQKGKMESVGHAGWETIYFRPGDDPFESFAASLYYLFGLDAPDQETFVKEAVEFMKNEATSFDDIYNKYNTHKHKNWLVFIDQFEEIFRFRNIDYSEQQLHEAQKFIQIILSVLNDTKLPVYVAITMRSDFIDSTTEFTGFPEALNEVFYLLPRFFGDNLKEAIVKPIEVCGGTITDRLVERLIIDADDKAERLPVLQHALMRTWDYWKINRIGDDPIDIHHYEAIGTMTMALSIHAEEIYNGISSIRGKEITETVFKALNDLDKDKKGIRRPVPLKDLILLTEAKEDEVVDIIDQFRAPGRAFLLPYDVQLTPDTIIDISHESIMRLWQRLKNWIEEETRSAELYLRLSDSAKLYQQGKTGLWIDTDLALATKWQDDNKPNALWASRYDPAFERAITFLDYSKKEYQTKIDQKSRRQARELKTARRTALILGSASILAVLLLVFALNLKFKAEASEKVALETGRKMKIASADADLQRKEAILEERIAEQQKSIASQQQSIAEEQRRNAIAEQKNADLQRAEAVQQKQVADQQRQEAVTQRKKADVARVAAIDSGKVAQSQRDRAVQATHEVENLRMLSEARTIAFKSNQLLSDAQKDTLSMQMAFLSYVINKEYGGPTQNRAIYDALKAQLNHYYNKMLRYTYGIKVNPGGYDLRSTAFVNNNDFFTAGDDGIVREWQITNSPVQINQKRATRSLNTPIYSVTLSPNKRYLLGRLGDGRVAVWDAENISSAPYILTDPNITSTQYATFLPVLDDNCVFVKSDKYAYVYNFTKPGFKLLNRFNLCIQSGGNSSQAGCYRTTKDGVAVYVAQGTSICALTFNNEGSLVAQSALLNVNDKISSLLLSSNEHTLAVGTDGGSTEIFNISGGKASLDTRISGHSSKVTGLGFTQNETTLASGSLDNTIRVGGWQGENKTEDLIFQDKRGWVRDIAMSPDNKYVLGVGQSGVIQLWPLTELTVLQEFAGVSSNKKMITTSLKEQEIEKEIGADIYKRLWAGKYKSFKDFWNSMTNKYLTRSA
jgi:WD40 repeat protein/energy-coupling factor transporter ATP-binding protein EcfA2